MNADGIFYIGKEHQVCEDYTIFGHDEGAAYIAVCDGCSASDDTCLGSRILAFSAQETYYRGNCKTADEFGADSIIRASSIFKMFPSLSRHALDATLLVAMVSKDKKLNAYIYGDGVMVHRKKDSIISVHVELSSGAPDYLSYHLDPARKQAYMGLEDNKKNIIVREGNIVSERIYSPFSPFIYTSDVTDGDVIAVISDGINSFRKSNNDPIPWTDLVDEFTGYKTVEGEFVLRRISAFKRKCVKDGITHSDDISVAAISI
jgi:hypothetical protein